MLTFDGRLDNSSELCELLNICHCDSPDSLIVLAAFERWGEDCFARLIGDWALALWDDRNHSFFLARDHAGTRALYFEYSGTTVRWSTCLETFFFNTRLRDFDIEYGTRYLACQPLCELTPFRGIRAVMPAHYLIFRDDRLTTKAHWRSFIRGEVRYKTDTEYEEHFFTLFQQSVKRRTGMGAPIIAELSGGMDSTSIVCMSDYIRSGERGGSPELLDTISYYDDSEPSWNEAPYFSAVEAKRGKTGIHVRHSFSNRTFSAADSLFPEVLLPGADSTTIGLDRKLSQILTQKGSKVILSGIGGDELLGGVPTGSPELADLLTTCEFGTLLKQAVEWSIPNRAPLLHTLVETFQLTWGLYREMEMDTRFIPPWISSVTRNFPSSIAYKKQSSRQALRFKPSQICNGVAWWSILESMPNSSLKVLTRCEYRYPYLDRDLVEFLFRIPRKQLIRPNERRSLMRRSLKSILPAEILERRRKAHLVRTPLIAIRQQKHWIKELLNNSLLQQLGLIDDTSIQAAFEGIIDGSDPKWWMGVVKACSLELWLRNCRWVSLSQLPVRLVANTRESKVRTNQA
jgi:asparagine synthase (glutamine-hydrolysing)